MQSIAYSQQSRRYRTNKMKWSLLFIAVLQLQGQEAMIDDEARRDYKERRLSTSDERPVLIPDAGLIRPPIAESCRRIKQSDPSAPSKMYTITVANPLFVPTTPKRIDVYCEMGLNGGGYTFLTPESIVQLQPSELAPMFTDRTSFLLRVRKTDGTQPYAVLKQLPQYATIPLTLGLSDNAGYNSPVNNYTYTLFGQPFLYFGFLPKQYATNNNVQGLQVNGFNDAFTNCDRNPSSHFALFPNFPEATPSTYDVPGSVCDQIFSRLFQNPSGRVMPPQIFMFGETHWGGCGCYKQSNQLSGILSFAIGFR